MIRWTGRTGFLCLLVVVMIGCSSSPEELRARHTKRGDEYFRKEMYKEAVIEYKNAVKAAPKDSSLRLKLAKAALEAKNINTAYEELQKAVERAPDNFEHLGKLGEIYVVAGKIEEASHGAGNPGESAAGGPQR